MKNELAVAGGSGNPYPFAQRLSSAQTLQETFELVKELVWKSLKVDQAGLMLGLVELGVQPGAVLGGFYSPDANTIVMNKTVLNQVRQLGNGYLYKSYCLYILLHEYLHSCGYYDQAENRQIVAALTAEAFGPGHAVTKFATTNDAMTKLVTMGLAAARQAGLPMQPGPQDRGIEFVQGIDRGNTDYIM